MGDSQSYMKMMKDSQAETKKAQTTIMNMGKSIEAVGAKIRNIGLGLSLAITTPLLLLGRAAQSEFTEFEAALSRMKGLVGLNDTEIQQFSTHIKELAVTTGKAPVELARAMENITSSGIQGAAALETLDITAKAAAGGLGEVRSVSDTVTSAMNAYGIANLSATKATDILVAAVREGKAEADTFAPVLGNVLPIANEMGISFDEAAGSIAYLTLATGSAATAATQYQNILAQTIKLNPEREAGKRLTELGIDVRKFQKSVGEQGLLPSLMKMKEELAKVGMSLKDAFPDVQAMTAALQLTGANSAKAASVIANVGKAAGSVDIAFQAAAKTAKFSFAQAMAESKVMMIELGEIIAPVMGQIISFTREAMKIWKGLSAETKNSVVQFAAVVAVVGPVLVGLGTLLTIGGGVVATLGAMAAGFMSLLTPINLVLAAIGVGGAYILSQTELWGKSVQWFSQQWSNVIEYVKPAIDGIKAAFEKGDIELAVKIAWAQIQLAFHEGIRPLRDMWIDFNAALAERFLKSVNDLRVGWQKVSMHAEGVITTLQGLISGKSEKEIIASLKPIVAKHQAAIKAIRKERDDAIAANAEIAKGQKKGMDANIKNLKAERDKLVDEAMADPVLKSLEITGSGLTAANSPAIAETQDSLKKLQDDAKITISLKRDAAATGSAEALERLKEYKDAISGIKLPTPEEAAIEVAQLNSKPQSIGEILQAQNPVGPAKSLSPIESVAETLNKGPFLIIAEGIKRLVALAEQKNAVGEVVEFVTEGLESIRG